MLEKALDEVKGAVNALDARLEDFRKALAGTNIGDLLKARKKLEEAVKGLKVCLNGLKVAFEKFKTKAGDKITTDDETKRKVNWVNIVINTANDLIKAAEDKLKEGNT